MDRHVAPLLAMTGLISVFLMNIAAAFVGFVLFVDTRFSHGCFLSA